MKIVRQGDGELENKQLVKYSFFNKYTMISAVGLYLILIISWFFESNFAEIWFMNYETPDLQPGMKKEIRNDLLSYSLTWENLVSSSMLHVVLIFPVFSTLATIPFSQEKNSYFIIGRSKFKSLSKAYYKSIIKYAFVSAGWMVLVFTIFFTIGGFFVINGLEDIGGLAAIFPEGFYNRYPYIVFLFMVWTIYFSFAFTFSLLASGLILWVNKGYLVMFGVLIFYHIYNAIGNMTGSLFFFIMETVTAYNTIFSTLQLFVPLLFILILALLLIFFGVRSNVRGHQL